MKLLKVSLTFIAFLCPLLAKVNGQLLLDRYVSENPVGAINWTNAGVSEDLVNAAIGSIGNSANEADIYNISHLRAEEKRADNLSRPDNPNYGGLRFPNNPLLNSYAWFKDQTYHLTLSGFVNDRGQPNVLTTLNYAPFEDARGNVFILEPNQSYKLYLFGVGYRDGQNTTFIFNGEEKTTNPRGYIEGSRENLHYVTFEFETPSDLRGWVLEFSARRTDLMSAGTGANGAFNGLALVPIH